MVNKYDIMIPLSIRLIHKPSTLPRSTVQPKLIFPIIIHKYHIFIDQFFSGWSYAFVLLSLSRILCASLLGLWPMVMRWRVHENIFCFAFRAHRKWCNEYIAWGDFRCEWCVRLWVCDVCAKFVLRTQNTSPTANAHYIFDFIIIYTRSACFVCEK